MKMKLCTLLLFLAIPVVARPEGLISTCAVQLTVWDGRDAEGLPIIGEDAQLTLSCIDKREMTEIISRYAKERGDSEEAALSAIRKAKQIRLVLSNGMGLRKKN